MNKTPDIPSSSVLSERLVDFASHSDWFMRALRAVQKLELSSWCIGAGAVRCLVWDKLHGRHTPSVVSDIDVAYFDSSNLVQQLDLDYQRELGLIVPDMPWEVTNQAGVHLWYEEYFGKAISAFSSLEEAVGTWPEYATSVGLTIDHNDVLHVIAPHGLEDLFSMTVRHNPTLVSKDTYHQRLAKRKYTEHWPMVKVVR